MKTKPSVLKLLFIKITHWEYWPMEIVYFPVTLYYFWLSLKARSFFFFSASNPSIETGGMLGESKFGILQNIPMEVKAFTLFFTKEIYFPEVLKSMHQNGLTLPVIAKPDIGERGTQVEKINNEQRKKFRA